MLNFIKSRRQLAIEPDYRIYKAEDHICRIEGMLGAMRLAATSELIDESVGYSISSMIEVLEDDCARLRMTLYNKESV